ncbi:MAG: hypothetical protein P8Y53_02860 [Pseudolabrys sp.]|jgi:hypothetical protein
MNATKGTERSQDSGRQDAKLDDHYGKIGISAVAGALRHKGEQRDTRDNRYRTVYDRD